jgi:ATP-binding cassette subfamily C (CFTR/MRP) protein 1
LILLFWPLYVLISAVRLRTLISTGQFSPRNNETIDLTRETLWLASIVFGLTDFMLELFSPEKKWKSFKLTSWRTDGKIQLSDSEDEDEAQDGVDAMNGGGAVPSKEEDGMESPVVTANIYERLTFSWLTRESRWCRLC